MKILKQLIAALCIIGGLAIVAYAIAGLIELPSLALGKFSTEARDTSSGIVFLLIGGALALAGLWNIEFSTNRPTERPGSASKAPPEA